MSRQADTETISPPKLGIFDRMARRALAGHLSTLKRGQIVLTDSTGTSRLGEPNDLTVSIQVHRPRFFGMAVMGGSLSVAESYLNGDWDCDNLTNLIRIFVRNPDAADRLEGGFALLQRGVQRFYHWFNQNSKSGSKRNIHAHYDLGNDFFRLWLDDSMAYSSGIFPQDDSSLYDASIEKFDRACRKLDLKPSDRLVEIGSGWGGMALHASRTYGCHVTTTTISQQQFDVARERIDDAEMAHRVSLLKQDYRDLTGQYDKLVSIEMIEAVGHQYLDTYFRKCSELLKPDGSFVLQAIVMPEKGYATYLKGVDFIQKYIFPGGCLPTVASILEAMGRSTDLRLVHMEDFAPHYAETLRRWNISFHQRLDDVRQLGYPEQFIRLWKYYLCYCEAVFEERRVGVVQLQFDKPLCRRDPIQLSERAAITTSHKVRASRKQTETDLCLAGGQS